MMHGGAMMGQHATARQPGMVQMVPMQMPPTMPRGGMGAPPGMVQMVPVQMVHPGMMMQQPPPHGYPPHGGYPPHAAPQWQQQYPPAGGPGRGRPRRRLRTRRTRDRPPAAAQLTDAPARTELRDVVVCIRLDETSRDASAPSPTIARASADGAGC